MPSKRLLWWWWLFSRSVVSYSFMTPWTVGAPPPRLLCPWDCPGENTGVGCDFLLLGIFPPQGLNLCFLPWQADSLPLSPKGSLFQMLLKIKSNLFRDIVI